MRSSDWSSDVCFVRSARDAADDLFLLAIDRAVAAHGNRQQQIAVLGHDIAQPLDHLFGGHVAFLLETRAIVMPVADAGARLPRLGRQAIGNRSEEHTSELQSLMRNSYAVFFLKKKKHNTTHNKVQDCQT